MAYLFGKFKYNRDNPHPNYRKLKPMVNKLFKALRQAGLIAKQNFWCCSTCACAAIPREKGADTAKGYAFYHKQGMASFVEEGSLYLHFGAMEREQDSMEIANILKTKLDELSIPYEWEGSPDKCFLIAVKPTSE